MVSSIRSGAFIRMTIAVPEHFGVSFALFVCITKIQQYNTKAAKLDASFTILTLFSFPLEIPGSA